MHERAKPLTDHKRLEIGIVVTTMFLLAFGIIFYLIWAAGAWAVAANTRFLDLLYRSGVVRLTDADQGYWDGAPQHDYFIRSQDWVDWSMVIFAALLLIAVWMLRAIRFHALTGAAGIEGTLRRHARLFLYGEEMGRYLPLDLGTVATLAPLSEGSDDHRPERLAGLMRMVRVGELVFFALLTMVLVGFATWFSSMVWALLVLATATYLLRGRVRSPLAATRDSIRSVRKTLASVVIEPSRWITVVSISLVSFPLEELVAYLVVQAFTSQHVVLGGATPSILLLALVAGKIAQSVRVTPGGIGQFELGFAASLVASGQGLAEAVTITLLFSLVRHVTGGIVLGITSIGRGAGTSAGEAVRWTANGSPGADGFPRPAVLGRRLLSIATLIVGFMLLNRVRLLLTDYWLLQSLGYESVFWTNFWTGLILFAFGALIWATAVIVPPLVAGVQGITLRTIVWAGVLIGILCGIWWAGQHQVAILAWNGGQFGENDPVFGRDIGFYVFDMPFLTLLFGGLALAATVGAISSIVWHSTRGQGSVGERIVDALRRPVSLVMIGVAGLSWAGRVWLSQYGVLTKDNYYSSIANGAEALDVTGFFSTVNAIRVETLVIIGVAATLVVWLTRSSSDGAEPKPLMRLLAPWFVLAIAFPTAVAIRDTVAISPNEPVVQLEFIGRHIEATNKAWGMDRVEVVDFTPNTFEQPLPDLDRLLTHPSVRNAQLWPGSSSWLEQLLDPQHVERILLSAGDKNPDLVFGATLDIFRQQQKLRAYYDFLDVDVVRVSVDGEPTLVTSSVRELPLLEPHPWLAYWGQRFVLFTHGYGLVAAKLGDVSPDGAPVYLSSGIPPATAEPALTAGNHSIYYGEGSGNIGFSNVRDLPELDYPTDQGREDVFLPADVNAGVRVDSLLKRLVFAWGTTEIFSPGSLFELAFSGLITSDTRIHYNRQPLDRINTVAPFLFLDADPYAVAGPDSIVWMVNGMTVSDRYPYSAIGELGDKSIRRGPFPTPTKQVNYVADSVKVTVDAYTGQIAFYRISDEPISAAWAKAYPSLFRTESDMPAEIYAQRQYPTQLFHTQFDDLYIYYHVTDPLAFFNQEDLFDDADEVLGPMVQQGAGITFSIEPYPSIVETGRDFPSADTVNQFTLNLAFTSEGAKNLRSIVSVYQDGADYGRISMLQVPKGQFFHGPEQAEAVIDQDALIAQQFGFWNSIGVEVLRGYITPVIVDGELIYIEPVFIRSAQNPFPQLNRVVVVLRGEAVMAPTLAEAMTDAWELVSGRSGTD